MNIETRKLENGLSVYLAHMPSALSMCVVFIVRAGWVYETSGVDVGAAHFFEHEGFKGTTRRPTARDVSYAIESVGGMGNASTDSEIICYLVHTRARHAELAVDIIADMVTDPLLEKNGIELEKSPIKEEYAGILIDPEAVLRDVFLNKLVFKNHPLGWIGTGTEEEIERIDRDLLVAYMDDLLTGPNSAIICAGNIEDPDRVFKVISDSFGGLSPSSPRRKRRVFKDSQTDLQLQLVEKDLEQTLVGIAIKDTSASDRYTLKVLNTILGRGMSCRLFLNVRDRLGLVYDIYTDLNMYPDISKLSFFANFNPLKWKEGLRAIVEEMRLIREVEVGEEELLKAKEMMFADIEFERERPEMIAQSLAEMWSLDNGAVDFERAEESIKAVSALDIASIAGRLFRSEKLNCAILGASSNQEEEARAILSALG